MIYDEACEEVVTLMQQNASIKTVGPKLHKLGLFVLFDVVDKIDIVDEIEGTEVPVALVGHTKVPSIVNEAFAAYVMKNELTLSEFPMVIVLLKTAQ